METSDIFWSNRNYNIRGFRYFCLQTRIFVDIKIIALSVSATAWFYWYCTHKGLHPIFNFGIRE